MSHHTIWSLYDMLRFYAATFGATMATLSRLVSQLYANEMIFEVESDYVDDRQDLKKELEEARDEFRSLPLSDVVLSLYDRIIEQTEEPACSRRELGTLVKELHNGVLTDLSSHLFMVIDKSRRSLYEIPSPPFGSRVQDSFPEAGIDINAASRCFALDEWTACVFHLMRVLEHGLKSLAKSLGVAENKIERKEWQSIIRQIEDKIKEMREGPDRGLRREEIKQLSDVATQFRYFKDAWRNNVNHVHENYDENAAIPVWNAVKSFMQTISDPTFPYGRQSPEQ